MPSKTIDDLKHGGLLTGPPAPKLLGDAHVVAEMLDVSELFLAKLRMKGKGPSYVMIGTLVRYVMPELPAWVEQYRCTSTSDPINPANGRGRFVAEAQKAAKAAKGQAKIKELA